jgi:hypothetical protein
LACVTALGNLYIATPLRHKIQKQETHYINDPGLLLRVRWPRREPHGLETHDTL